MKGRNELIWETQPVPGNARDQTRFSVTWEGGMGYFAEPQGTFTLSVNDERILEIPALSEQSTVWFNADRTVSLKYERDASRPEMGQLTLSLPSSMVTPGQPLLLKVTGSDSKSRRWFGVFETF
jgi:alpha-mannosidase